MFKYLRIALLPIAAVLLASPHVVANDLNSQERPISRPPYLKLVSDCTDKCKALWETCTIYKCLEDRVQGRPLTPFCEKNERECNGEQRACLRAC